MRRLQTRIERLLLGGDAALPRLQMLVGRARPLVQSGFRRTQPSPAPGYVQESVSASLDFPASLAAVLATAQERLEQYKHQQQLQQQRAAMRAVSAALIAELGDLETTLRGEDSVDQCRCTLALMRADGFLSDPRERDANDVEQVSRRVTQVREVETLQTTHTRSNAPSPPPPPPPPHSTLPFADRL